jgi:anti-sigma factor RsiW
MNFGAFSHLGEAISAYLDGELKTPELGKVSGHLAGCDVCRDELDSMMEVRARLRSLPTLELPAGILDAEPKARPLHRRPRVLVGAAAAVAAILLAVATITAPRDVVGLTDSDFFQSYRARQSLDPNSTGRLIPLEVVPTQTPDSGPGAGGT